MRRKAIVISIAFCLWVLGAALIPVHAQKSGTDAEKELDALLPDGDDAKVLIMTYCTSCHSAATTKQRISARRGDKTFWETLVHRMITVWNAQILEEDVDPIASYLAKNFGPSKAAESVTPKKEEKKGEGEKEQKSEKDASSEKKSP